MATNDELIAWHDEQSNGVKLSESGLLDNLKQEIRAADSENDGSNPAINRLVDALSIVHDIMRRRLNSEQAEEHHAKLMDMIDDKPQVILKR